MPSTRRSPNAVAIQATAGAINIWDAVDAVLSHAPLVEAQFQRPAQVRQRAIENSRVSKLARKSAEQDRANREQRTARDLAR